MKDLLIVEDNDAVRRDLYSFLLGEGVQVDEANSVSKAEVLLEQTSYHIVLLDIGLDDQSGSVLFHKLKERQAARHIVIFTGNPSEHLRKRFLDEGARDYLVKGQPAASKKQVLRLVKELLRDKQSQDLKGLPLETFLSDLVSPDAKPLFLDDDGRLPSCESCGGRDYRVVFSTELPNPPLVTGRICCSVCGADFALSLR